MKQLLILSISLLLVSCSGKSQNKATENQIKKNTIEVFDFHTTNRCVTCEAIEANTKYTLETYFANELKSGKITFNVINIDLKENEKLSEKFQAAGTSLFLNVIDDKKENQIDLTNFAFTYGNKQNEFSEKLKVTIEKELAKI